MRKTLLIITSLVLLIVSSCTKAVNAPAPEAVPSDEVSQPDGQTFDDEPESEEGIKGKIGIITGTSEQCAEEFGAALRMKEKFGDMIIVSSYPDILTPKVDALALNMKSLADEGAEAIIVSPSSEGTAEAIQRLRSSYPDILVISAESSEKPEIIAAQSDIVLNTDEEGFADSVIKQARSMGAKVFVHYTFARHMGDKTLSGRRDMFMDSCEKESIQFVDATIPDPQDEVAEPGATEKYVIDDVPKMVANYGKDTAFYSTEESVQEALIKSILWEGALFPIQCEPSPFFAYPGALGIQIPFDKSGDAAYVLEQTKKELTSKGGEGRFSTWPLPLERLFIEAGTEYAVEFLVGGLMSRNDTDGLKKICADSAGVDTFEFRTSDAPSGETLENFYYILPDFVDF